MQSSKIKMDEFKSKFMDLLHKQTNRQVKIPAMGFSDYFVHTVTASEPLKDISRSSGMCNKLDAEHKSNARDDIGDDEDIACNENDMALVSSQKSDQEILESVDKIYFRNDNNTDLYELKKVLANGVDYELINTTIAQLRKQHKVISKQVLQNILEQRNACIVELAAINETQKELEEALWICRKGRSYLNDAKTNLTTTSLQILASYRKREIYKELLSTLRAINKLKSTDVEVQKLLSECNYSGAIALLLNCKDFASEFMQYNCVQSLDKKLQETLLLTEFQLDMVLNEMILNFDLTKYIKLQQAYKLLNKSLIAMDQIHINYISAIHSSVNSVVRSYIILNNNNNDAATTTTTTTKYLYEQLCEQVEADKYVTCLIHLCNTIWTILSSYYQIIVWHQNHKLYPQDVNDIVHNDDSMENDTTDAYIQEKLGKGQSRIWNDILTKICIYLQSTKLITLKYEHFIQVLAIAQRLKKVGQEFCGENSEKLIETMRMKSELFFDSYHIACLEEVCLFLENESWTYVESFTNILQLSEFRSVRYALRRHKSPPIVSMHTSASINNSPISIINNNTNNNRHNNNNNNNNKNNNNNNNNNNGNNNNNNNTNSNNCDELVSIHSQDGISSIYGSCGYFIRFSEKSSPFDGGLDVAMLEEDILSGVVDEASCYFSEESDDEQKSLQSKMGDFDESLCTISNTNSNSNVMVNSTTLNIFRCMGRYLQMCKLLHCVSPKIIASMLKLMDFYVYAVYEVFAKDTPVQLENFYSQKLEEKLDFVRQHIVPHIKIWPLNFSSLTNNELSNPDTLYGLPQRIVAVQSGHCMLQQFYLLHNYLNHLLPPQEHSMLSTYFDYTNYMTDLARPVYTCVTLRVFDINSILAIMAKVKWNIKHVTSLNNTYIDIMCRNVQHFAMRLEEISKEITISLEQLWNCMAHVATHLLVEGFSQVKECTPGGRALMQLDFINFMSILELISKQKFPNHRAYVDTFIKVYYFSNEQLEDWIMEQISASSTTITPTTSSSLTSASSSPYSTKQLMNLVSVGGREKKTRQKLLNLLTGESNLNTSTNAIT